jgi:hypothetical protein
MLATGVVEAASDEAQLALGAGLCVPCANDTSSTLTGVASGALAAVGLDAIISQASKGERNFGVISVRTLE